MNEGAKVMGVPRGGLEGAIAPPLPGWLAKIVFFFTFLEENSMFLGVFEANSMFLPSGIPRKFCPPLKKSLRTHMA